MGARAPTSSAAGDEYLTRRTTPAHARAVCPFRLHWQLVTNNLTRGRPSNSAPTEALATTARHSRCAHHTCAGDTDWLCLGCFCRGSGGRACGWHGASCDLRCGPFFCFFLFLDLTNFCVFSPSPLPPTGVLARNRIRSCVLCLLQADSAFGRDATGHTTRISVLLSTYVAAASTCASLGAHSPRTCDTACASAFSQFASVTAAGFPEVWAAGWAAVVSNTTVAQVTSSAAAQGSLLGVVASPASSTACQEEGYVALFHCVPFIS